MREPKTKKLPCSRTFQLKQTLASTPHHRFGNLEQGIYVYTYMHILNLVTKTNIIQYTQLSMLSFFLLTHFNLKIHGVGEKKESGKLKQIGKVVSSYCWSILNKAYTIGNIILFIIFRSSWSDKAWPNQKMCNCIPQYYLEAVACRWTQNGQGWSQPRPWSCPARLPRSSPAPINPAASRSSRSWIRGVF